MESESKSTKIASIFAGGDNATRVAIMVLIGLISFFFIPSSSVLLSFSKSLLLYVGMAVVFSMWTISRLREGKITLPWHYAFIALTALPVAYGLATLFSGSRAVSFLGQGFESETCALILVLSLLTFITTSLFSSKKAITYAYFSFLISFPIIILFQLVRLFFGPNVLSFSVFLSDTASLVGGWNDLGIYCGLIALFTFLTLELLPIERWMKTTLIVSFASALFFLTVINFTTVWYVLGIIALIFFIYNFSFNRSNQRLVAKNTSSNKTVPLMSLIVIILSFVFIITNTNIYTTLSSEPINIHFFNKFAISNIEVRPSWSSTFHIAGNSLKKHPIFGVGPNRFVTDWLLLKPNDVNNTIFWSTDFNYATGYIPTALMTTGLLGFLAWLAFLSIFLVSGFKALFQKTDTLRRYLISSSFIVSLYLWIFAFFYIPSITLLILTFFFTGLFFASLIEDGLIKERTFDIARDPRTSFISVLAFIVVILGTVIFGYTIVKKFTASVYFNSALVKANTSADIATVESLVNKALRFNESDQYYRAQTNINLAKINALVSNQKNIAPDILQNQFRNFLTVAVTSAQKALSLDDTNYVNYINYANVYNLLVPLGNSDAYGQAQAGYTRAATLDPTNPAIPLALAQLEVAHKDTAKAKQYITQAIQLKNNYTDAIYLLSQIQVNEGDLASAIQSVQAAAQITPNDPGVYFELGLLRYNNKDYAGAGSAFQQAVALSPDYANAKYFLGLSAYKLGQQQVAIKQFQDLKITNPDNKEVSFILSNLLAGKDPFANVAPPLDNKPEKRSHPPLKDTNSSKKSSPAVVQ